MATSGPSAASPRRSGDSYKGTGFGRPLAWSRNTAYQNAAGVHSEVSGQATDERQLNANVSTLQTVQQKKRRQLRQQRKSLEASMLAYSQNMRKISMERLMISSTKTTSPTLQPSLQAAPLNKSSSDDPLSQTRQQDCTNCDAADIHLSAGRIEPGYSSGSPVDKNARISVDSGIELEETASMQDLRGRKVSDNRYWAKVQQSTSFSSISLDFDKKIPTSFHAFGSDPAEHEGVSHNSAGQNKKKLSLDSLSSGGPASKGSRQRRPGTTEKPDMLTIRLSMQQTHHIPSIRLDDEHRGSPCLDIGSETLSITPFPELVCFSPAPDSYLLSVRSRDLSYSPLHHADDDSAEGVSSSFTSHKTNTPRAKQKMSVYTRENYWSFRKARKRFSIKPEKVQSFLVSHPRPIRLTKYKPPRPLPQKTYFSSFRYSEAVENVLKSFEDKDKSPIKAASALRKASQALPSLDIEDLKQERQRLKKESKLKASKSAEGSTFGNAAGDLQRRQAAVSRERSSSAPSILSHSRDSVSAGSENIRVKPILRRFQSTYFSEELHHKAVQFLLPSERAMD